MSKDTMTIGQFLDRPVNRKHPRRFVLLMRIPGKATARIIHYIFS
ncbi:hypothetical protein [Paenibacillus hamazuiensis]|nr:hypothetical protein [Paenibacillus hamazuiensis]